MYFLELYRSSHGDPWLLPQALLVAKTKFACKICFFQRWTDDAGSAIYQKIMVYVHAGHNMLRHQKDMTNNVMLRMFFCSGCDFAFTVVTVIDEFFQTNHIFI